MDISEVDICNHALIMIGTPQFIVSFDEGSGLANTLKRVYPLARNEVLRLHEWNCAIARETLAQLEDTPVSGYSYQYQLPVAPLCLRVLNIESVVDVDYRIEGDRLLTNEDSVSIRYVKELTDTTKYSPLLVKTLAAKIAADIAFSVTQLQQVESAMESKFEYYLNRAKGIDNMESEGPDPETNTSWIDEGRS